MIWYIFGVVVCLTVDLFVWLTCWFWGAIAAIFNLDALPRPFNLLHTHDDDIYGSKTTKEPRPATVWARWKRATWWMLRNPGYGLQSLFGVPVRDVITVSSEGEIDTGIHDRFIMHADKNYAWGYRRDLMWSRWFYCKMWFGWHRKAQGPTHVLKFDFHPFKKVSNR